MTLRWLIASLHLLGLALSLASVWTRGRALKGPHGRRRAAPRLGCGQRVGRLGDRLHRHRALAGLWRNREGTAYYLQNHSFLAKMGLLALILLLEIWPIVTLIRWRIRRARNQPVDLSAALASHASA